MPPVPILTVNDLGKSYGAEEIFSGVTFQIVEREHVALVGVNGAGKSTVLRIVAGIEHPTEGTVAPLKGLRITYLPQEASFTSDKTLREEARLAFTPVLEMQARMRDIETQMASAGNDHLEAIMDEYARLQTRFETAGGYDIEHRTDEVLNGLGFAEEQFDQPVAQLSGGQKTRVALAKALLADPDLLLLDEPTNHLDLEMLEWLEGFLRSWSGACLIVSHDRYFLDRVTTRTMDLSFGRLEDYPAPYGRFLELREERMERRWKEYQEQQEYIARQEEFIRKYGAGQRYREARGRLKKLDRLERIDRPQEHDRLAIRIGSAVRSGRMVLSTTEMSIGYAEDSETGRPVELLRTPELEVERGDRIGLLGPNGSGKTTLLKTLMGILPTLDGDYHLGTNVHPGYYAQSHEQLRGRGQGTPLSVILDVQPMSEEAARTYLGRFLFSGDDVYKQVASLSGGERSRLALAVLLLERANFLVLDEPTNHLDINARESLEQMLTGFDGTILFVSHDRYFIDKVATKLWVVEDGTINEQLGNYTDFHRRLEAAASPPQPEPKSEPKAENTASPNGDATMSITSKGKPRRKTSADVEKRLTKVEREISQLEGKVNELSDALAIASADQDLDAVARLGEEYERLQNELEDTYQRWEAITEERELVAAESGE